MPTTEKQRRAAFAELGKRKKGTKRAKRRTKRPFGKASTKTLMDFAHSPLKSSRGK